MVPRKTWSVRKFSICVNACVLRRSERALRRHCFNDRLANDAVWINLSGSYGRIIGRRTMERLGKDVDRLISELEEHNAIWIRSPASENQVSVENSDILGNCFLKEPSRRLFYLFSSLQTNITIFTTNICKKCPSSIRCWDSNPQPSIHEFLPITTVPGVPSSFYLMLLRSPGTIT